MGRDSSERRGRVGRRGLRRVALAGVLVAGLTAGVALAQGPPPGGYLDEVVQNYQVASGGWLERLVPMAQRTFAVLAGLELAVSGIWWALGREGLDAATAGLLRKFIVLSFLFSLITLFPLWSGAIVGGFQAAGQGATGLGVVNPSQILDLGISIAAHMMLAFFSVGTLVSATGNVLAAAIAMLVLLAYIGIAARLCLTLVEASLVLTGGVLFLGFAAFRSTASLAEGYLMYVVQVGVKIFLIYLLVGVGSALSQEWAAIDFSPGLSPASLAPEAQVLGGAVVLCLLVWRVPSAVAGRLAQGSSLRLGDALR
jgi:type IV secretion system protein TrbL